MYSAVRVQRPVTALLRSERMHLRHSLGIQHRFREFHHIGESAGVKPQELPQRLRVTDTLRNELLRSGDRQRRQPTGDNRGKTRNAAQSMTLFQSHTRSPSLSAVVALPHKALRWTSLKQNRELSPSDRLAALSGSRTQPHRGETLITSCTHPSCQAAIRREMPMCMRPQYVRSSLHKPLRSPTPPMP
ncbi:MAG: hypothetical protein JWR34_7411 [Mycobacterium sp.]|nr:hypothetical protein [Mycobacterium sp.]